jgi:RNA polymerase sigma factor (sigma-70 family)
MDQQTLLGWAFAVVEALGNSPGGGLTLLEEFRQSLGLGAPGLKDLLKCLFGARDETGAPVFGDEDLAVVIRDDQTKVFAPHAFEELFWNRYGSRLLEAFRFRGASAEEAEELQAILFLNFFEQRLHTFGGENPNFSAYLMRSARNLWIGHSQSSQSARACLQRVASEGGKSAADPPVTEAIEEERRQLIERLMVSVRRAVEESLREEEAAVMRLWLEGLPRTEIATRLGLSYTTVTMRLYHAKRKVAALLGQRYSAEDLDLLCGD